MANYTQGFSGGLGGAMQGAAMGSVIPGIGTGIGALAGGAVGLLGGLFGGGGNDEYRKRLAAMEQEFANREAPQAGSAERGQYSNFRGNQAALISQLEALSRGQGPSLAALQMREAMDRAAGAQAGLAAGAAGRGVGQGAALRNAANTTAAIQSQGARDTGMMRANEQLGALNQLGITIHSARGADESMNRFNASQGNQFALANLDAQLRAMGMNDAARLQALQSAMQGGGPGLGTQILAGGANAFGGIMGQMAAGRQNPQQQQMANPFAYNQAMNPSSGYGAFQYGGYEGNPMGPSGQGGPINPYG